MQVITDTGSKRRKGAIKTWTHQGQDKQSNIHKIVDSLTRNTNAKIPMDCDRCSQSDKTCTCSVKKIRHEASYDIYVILQSYRPGRPQATSDWCPVKEKKSEYFNCGNNKTVSASLLCDGYPDCENKRDEAGLVCQSWKYKAIAVTVILVTYGLGLSVAMYYECQDGVREEDIEMEAVGRSENVGQKKVVGALKILINFVKDKQLVEETKLRQLDTRTNLGLMKLAWNIDMKNKAIPGRQRAFHTLSFS